MITIVFMFHYSPRISGTQNGGILNLIAGYFGVGKLPYIGPIHTAYIGEDSSILGTVPEKFGECLLLIHFFVGIKNESI